MPESKDRVKFACSKVSRTVIITGKINFYYQQTDIYKNLDTHIMYNHLKKRAHPIFS